MESALPTLSSSVSAWTDGATCFFFLVLIMSFGKRVYKNGRRRMMVSVSCCVWFIFLRYAALSGGKGAHFGRKVDEFGLVALWSTSAKRFVTLEEHLVTNKYWRNMATSICNTTGKISKWTLNCGTQTHSTKSNNRAWNSRIRFTCVPSN